MIFQTATQELCIGRNVKIFMLRKNKKYPNLPKEKKMIEPAYNDIPAEKFPTVQFPRGEAKIIAGTFSGVTSPGSSHTGMLYYDISLEAGTDINIPINDKWNGFFYVY